MYRWDRKTTINGHFSTLSKHFCLHIKQFLLWTPATKWWRGYCVHSIGRQDISEAQNLTAQRCPSHPVSQTLHKSHVILKTCHLWRDEPLAMSWVSIYNSTILWELSDLAWGKLRIQRLLGETAGSEQPVSMRCLIWAFASQVCLI